MDVLYPAIEPDAHGMLEAGDGNRVYWEQCGNPEGLAVLVVHGGPGSGCTEMARRYFDPARYRIVLFDQRQCGRSTPHASDPATDITSNTTWHLVADMESLRMHLAIERWVLFGQSWGSTLALAYAEQHPERVAGMVLGSVTTTTREEIGWLTGGVGRFFPEAWERFHAGAGRTPAGTNMAAAYRDLLASPDPAVRERAASDWCEWEMAIVDTTPGHRPHPRYEDPGFRMAFARIVTHYFAAGAWLEEGQLLRNAGRLAGIPGALVHGRLDYSSPLHTAWQLAQAWPDAELTVVEPAGHDARDGDMAAALVAATDRLARSVRG